MSLMLVILKKLFGFLHSVLACFKRLLCFLRIRSREPDVLPYTVTSTSYDSLPSAPFGHTGSADQSWDSWNPISDKIEAYREKMIREKEEEERKKLAGETEQNKEPDYFQEIAPDVRKIKTKKIVLKQKGSRNPASLFSMQNAGPLLPEATSELGTLDDTGQSESWDVDDPELDVDSVIKEAKQKERLERQQKRKEKRDRLTSTGSARGFEAIRLS